MTLRDGEIIVSRHLLRRTAQARERWLTDEFAMYRYRVIRVPNSLFKWAVARSDKARAEKTYWPDLAA